jgi:predicted transcriptional regulator
MGVLMSQGEVTMTNLAMLSRVNYQRCKELSSRLEESGYAEIKAHHQKRYVILTESGYDYGRRLLEVNGMTRVLDAAAEHDAYLEKASETHVTS